MNLIDITAVVLTFNEEANIGRCLERLRRLGRVLIIDSGSTDATLALCAGFSNVAVLHRPFDTHTAQWNFGLDQARTAWVLALDADYIVNEAFLLEVQGLKPGPGQAAWSSGFHYVVAGKRLRGTLYPPRAILFDRHVCRYRQDGHTQLLEVGGETGVLRTRIDHDDRKSLSRWLDSQRRYAVLEAEKFLTSGPPSGWPDRLRAMIWPAAPAALFYTLLRKGLILDGWPGFYYALQRVYAEMLLSLHLLNRRLEHSFGPNEGRRDD